MAMYASEPIQPEYLIESARESLDGLCQDEHTCIWINNSKRRKTLLNRVNHLKSPLMIKTCKDNVTLNERMKANELYLKLGYVKYRKSDYRIQAPAKNPDGKGHVESYHESFKALVNSNNCALEYQGNGQIKLKEKKLDNDGYCEAITKEMARKWMSCFDNLYILKGREKELKDCLRFGIKTFAWQYMALMKLRGWDESFKRRTQEIIALSVYLVVLDEVFHRRVHCCGIKVTVNSILEGDSAATNHTQNTREQRQNTDDADESGDADKSDETDESDDESDESDDECNDESNESEDSSDESDDKSDDESDDDDVGESDSDDNQLEKRGFIGKKRKELFTTTKKLRCKRMRRS